MTEREFTVQSAEYDEEAGEIVYKYAEDDRSTIWSGTLEFGDGRDTLTAASACELAEDLVGKTIVRSEQQLKR